MSLLYRPLSFSFRPWTTITRTGDGLTLHALGHKVFPYIWLRDSCQSPASVHPSTKQKLHRTSDIPLDIAPIDGEGGVRVIEPGLEIQWNDGTKSMFEKHWLERHASPIGVEKFHWDNTLKQLPWTRASICSPSLFLSYQEILSSDEGLEKAMVQLSKYGLLFVRGVPNNETNDENCELKKLAENFGELRKTFYGLVWNVISLQDSKNIAYTSLELGLHMDLLYFEHPPRYQILHCLRNKVLGGTSIFVDALHVASLFRETHPIDFDILSKTPVSFHYVNDGHHLHRDHFTIELAPPTLSSSLREISHINYSPPFQAPLPLSTPKEFYPALKRFTDLLNEEMHTFEFTLEEGDAVLFDNRRVLHARTAFRSRTKEERNTQSGKVTRVESGEPDRWLKGCYLEADSLLDRLRVLKDRLALAKHSDMGVKFK